MLLAIPPDTLARLAMLRKLHENVKDDSVPGDKAAEATKSQRGAADTKAASRRRPSPR